MARLREQHVEATRQALLAAARRRFGTVGFAGTSLDEIAADAGVTKGALYHHFGSKEQLFLAVYDAVEGELSARAVEAAVGGTDPLDLIRRGFAAFLDLALDPAVQRIALLDAPSVLGAATKQEIDARHSLGAVRAALEAAADAGQLVTPDAGVLAQLLLAACSRAAVIIATADDPAAARTTVGRTLDRLLDGLAP